MKKLVLFIYIAFLSFGVNAQKKQYKIHCVAFYNLENLFDTIANNPRKRDLDYTPDGDKRWGSRLYKKKLEDMAKVIQKLGQDMTPVGPTVLGVSEVENRQVLEDLVNMPSLKPFDFKIVHFDSPDYRGIDVAFLYQARFFKVENTRSVELFFPDDPDFKTRDQLVVTGLLDGERMHFIVNHWPSRRGGEKRSRPNRNMVADLSRAIVDSIYAVEPNAKIMVMGDFNDDPINQSLVKHLKAKGKIKKVDKGGLYNPMYPMFKKGIGSLAYRDGWNLFDQIVISEPLVNAGSKTYRYYKAEVFNRKWLTMSTGRYQGYPKRTHVGNTYQGGYSDHFPVYIYLVKEI